VARDNGFVGDKNKQIEQQPFLMVCSDGRIMVCNQAFAELVGYTQDELKNMRWDTELTPPEWQQEEEKMLKELPDSDQPHLFVKEYLCNDGSRVPVELLVYTIRDCSGEVQYYCAFIKEIVAKKEDDTQRQIERGHFSLMGHWPGFIYRCVNNKDWTMKWIYGDFKGVTGYDIEDVIDDKIISWGKIVHPDDHERTWDVAQVGINESRPFQQEYRIVTKDGGVKWVLEQCIGVTNSKGEEFFEGFITDISERKRAEEQIKTILINCKKSLKEQYNLNSKVISDLQKLVLSQEVDPEKIQQSIKTLLCVQSRICRLVDSVSIDFAGFNLLAQEVEFIFDGKNYFYPKVMSIFSEHR